MSDHSELIARLLDSSDTTALEAVDEAAAALREQAGEIERLRAELAALKAQLAP